MYVVVAQFWRQEHVMLINISLAEALTQQTWMEYIKGLPARITRLEFSTAWDKLIY